MLKSRLRFLSSFLLMTQVKNKVSCLKYDVFPIGIQKIQKKLNMCAMYFHLFFRKLKI